MGMKEDWADALKPYHKSKAVKKFWGAKSKALHEKKEGKSGEALEKKKESK